MSNHRWFRLLPEWLVSSRTDGIWLDVVAGLTTGAVIIPKAMAYAMMAGLPVQVGLYTALVPMVIYAVLGTSRVLSVSTTTTLAILTAAQLGQVVLNGNTAALLRASATLTLLVGAALLLASTEEPRLRRLHPFSANATREPMMRSKPIQKDLYIDGSFHCADAWSQLRYRGLGAYSKLCRSEICVHPTFIRTGPGAPTSQNVKGTRPTGWTTPQRGTWPSPPISHSVTKFADAQSRQ